MGARSAARAKGNAREAEVQAYLEGRGYFVDRAVQTGTRVPCKPCPRCSFKGSIWIARSNDRWGLFDLLAEAADQPKLLAVQVTYDTGVSGRRKKILEHAHRFNLDRTDVLVYIWHPARKEWTAERLIVKPTDPALFADPPAGIAEDGSSFPGIKRTFLFEKLGSIDIPKARKTAGRKEHDDGEGPDVRGEEDHEDEGGEEEAEAGEVAGSDL